MVNPFSSQRVYLDSSTFIYWIETPDLCGGFVTNLETAIRTGGCTLVTSILSLSEILVKPFRDEDLILALAYIELLLEAGVVECLPVDQLVARRAAGIRSKTSLRTPDSIHLATGQLARCTLFTTSDRAWSQAGVPLCDPLVM